jgi:hypothetical protein
VCRADGSRVACDVTFLEGFDTTNALMDVFFTHYETT